MATTMRGIRTPDLSDLFQPTSQLATMAGDIDDAAVGLADQTRFDHWVKTSNQTLYGDWRRWANVFAPPSGWASWGCLVVCVSDVHGLAQGDVVESLIGSTAPNGPKQEDVGGTARAIEMAATFGPLTGTHTFDRYIRNTTANNGTVSTSWMHIVAYRLT